MTDTTDVDRGRLARSLERIGVDQPTDAVVWTWVDAGFDADRELDWPAEPPRRELELSAADDAAGLDVLAAVLDETAREHAELFVHVALGRRDDLPEGKTFAIEALSRHPEVTVSDHHTVGAVPFTAEAFESLTRLYGDDLVHATVFDADGEPIVERRDWTTLRFAIDEGARDRLREALPASVAERLERR